MSANVRTLRNGFSISEEFYVNCGVREGAGILWPLLFISYFSDVFQEMGRLFTPDKPFDGVAFGVHVATSLLLYADDSLSDEVEETFICLSVNKRG